jgi:hypothetical protein
MKLSDFLNERIIDTMGMEKTLTKAIYEKFLSLLEEFGNFGNLAKSEAAVKEIYSTNFATYIMPKLKKIFPDKDLSNLGIFCSFTAEYPGEERTPLAMSLLAYKGFKKKILKNVRKQRMGGVFSNFSLSSTDKEHKEKMTEKYKGHKDLETLKMVFATDPTFTLGFQLPFIVDAEEWKKEKRIIQDFLSHELTHLIQGIYHKESFAQLDKKINPVKLGKIGTKPMPGKIIIPKYGKSEIESMTYLNKPAEVRAFARTLYDEIKAYAKKFKIEITKDNFISLAKDTHIYPRLKSTQTDENWHHTLKIVYQRFFD